MKRKVFDAKHSKVTRSLKNFVLGYEKSLPKDNFEHFLGTLDDALKLAYAEITSVPEGPARARKLQQMVEDEIARETKIKVSCAKGCSACCHFEVEVTNYEAEILTDLVKAGHPISRERLTAQSQRKLQDGQWREGTRNATNPCVFLGGEGACTIYEHRPVMCRRHSVTSEPINCDTRDAQISLRFFPRVDMLISAANEDPGLTIGPLAKFLEIKLRE
jgi:Fe-S-cluster containining protein